MPACAPLERASYALTGSPTAASSRCFASPRGRGAAAGRIPSGSAPPHRPHPHAVHRRASAYDAWGQKLKPNDRVKPEQHILLWRPPWDETPVPVEVETLYEDDHLWAVNKPANLPVASDGALPPQHADQDPPAPRPGEFLSLGHRLDRETSGVILLTKTVACDRSLKRQLESARASRRLTWPSPGACPIEATARKASASSAAWSSIPRAVTK